MAQVKKAKLSGSTDGRNILQVATASPGTLVHTSVAGVVAGTFDEIWLYAYNANTSSVVLTIEFGGTTSNDAIKVTLGAQAGLVPIIPGLILQNGTIVRVYASVANVILISGYVNAVSA